VPPACEKIHLMSGNCSAEPLNSKLAIVRVVSVPSSISGSNTSGTRFRQQSFLNGCVYTTALRRFSSSITGLNAGSPRNFPW
jgi:hypothetical protein